MVMGKKVSCKKKKYRAKIFFCVEMVRLWAGVFIYMISKYVEVQEVFASIFSSNYLKIRNSELKMGRGMCQKVFDLK